MLTKSYFENLIEALRGKRQVPGDPVRPENFADIQTRTLSRWQSRLGAATFKIECPTMDLWGRDHEGAIFTGPGRIEIDSAANIRFWIYATAADFGTAFKKLRSAEAHPYDALEQFRLFATDYDRNRWTGGFTQVTAFAEENGGWPLTGELRGLSTDVEGPWVAPGKGVELLFRPALSLPMSEWQSTTTWLGGKAISHSRRAARQIVQVNGIRIVFSLDSNETALWIAADTRDEMNHPYLERWLSEPLRILLGAPVWPTLIARNFGDRKASVTLLPAPRHRRPSLFGLMPPFGMGRDHDERFWQTYADLLTMIANERVDDHPNMDGHEVTHLYQELAQVQQSSRWVMLLTLASTIEALAKSLMEPEDRRSDFTDDDIAKMAEAIRAAPVDGRLRERVSSNLAMVRGRSVLSYLRQLARNGALNAEEIGIWQRLRNSVMHGELVEPWSSAEGDRHLREMIDLTHALTRLRIVKG